MRKVMGILAMALLLLGAFVSFTPSAAWGQQASPCPPGQPDEFEPGNPDQGRKPSGRPAYPPGECNLRLNKSVAAQGESVQAVGSGFAPGSEVNLALNGQGVGVAATDTQGGFVSDFTVPTNAALGQGTVTATQGARVLSASLEVVAPAGATRASRGAEVAAGSLSRTGRDVANLVGLGGSLVVVGAVVVIAARRRRRELGATV